MKLQSITIEIESWENMSLSACVALLRLEFSKLESPTSSQLILYGIRIWWIRSWGSFRHSWLSKSIFEKKNRLLSRVQRWGWPQVNTKSSKPNQDIMTYLQDIRIWITSPEWHDCNEPTHKFSISQLRTQNTIISCFQPAIRAPFLFGRSPYVILTQNSKLC